MSDEVFGSQTEMQVFCSDLREDRSLPRSRTKTHLIVIISMNKDPEGVSYNPSGLRFPQVGLSLHCKAELTRPCVIYQPTLVFFLSVNIGYLFLSLCTKYDFYLEEVKCKSSQKSQISFISCFAFLFLNV